MALLLIFRSASAQQKPTFSTEANLVPVPTLVRDAAGAAVYGLREKDFILEDDGIEQDVHLDEAEDEDTEDTEDEDLLPKTTIQVRHGHLPNGTGILI